MSQLEKAANQGLTIALPIAILGAVFRLAHFPFANQLLVIGLASVAFWALFKYALEQTLEGYATGLAIAIGCIAMLFKLEHWANADLLLKCAIGAGVILGAVILFARNQKNG